MGLQNFEIILDNRSKTYYSGQTINGKVEFTLSSQKKIDGISIKFKGEVKTSWSESKTITESDGNKKSVTEYFKGHEEYFNVQQSLLSGANGNPIALDAGNHSFPFSYTLPENIPSSFEGEYGSIRYTIKATLNRPWKFDQDIKVALSVVSLVDLNIYPQLKDPFSRQSEKTFWTLFSESKPLTVTVLLPRTGYVPGEIIPLQIKCHNLSNIDVITLKCKLQKLITYYSRTPRRKSKVEQATILKDSSDSVKAGENKQFGLHIVIPPIPPTNFMPHAIIDIKYEILIKAYISGLHKNMEFSFPITIGTIPFATFTSAPSPTSPIPITPSAPSAAIDDNACAAPPPYNSLYPNLPPPTYEESKFKTSSIKDETDTEYTRGDSAYFAPRYPVFSYAPSAPPLGK